MKAQRAHAGAVMTAPEVRAWFVREVLPLEADLMQYLHHNWRNQSDIADLRQDVYVRVLEEREARNTRARHAFVFTTARNLLIDRVRRERIIPIRCGGRRSMRLVLRWMRPGRIAPRLARDELRRLQAALDRLPERPREAVVMGRVEGLTRARNCGTMGISEAAVSKHIDAGIRAFGRHSLWRTRRQAEARMNEAIWMPRCHWRRRVVEEIAASWVRRRHFGEWGEAGSGGP